MVSIDFCYLVVIRIFFQHRGIVKKIFDLLFIAILKRKEFRIDFMLIYLIVTYFIIIIFTRNEYLLQFATNSNSGGFHYSFFPMCIILILIFRHIETFKTGSYKIFLLIAILLISLNLIYCYSIPSFHDYYFSELTSGYTPNGQYLCTIPINPDWKFSFPSDYCYTNENKAMNFDNGKFYMTYNLRLVHNSTSLSIN